MRFEKNDLHYSFENNCRNLLYGLSYGSHPFDYDAELGVYCYPHIQSAFVIFCKGYDAAHRGL